MNKKTCRDSEGQKKVLFWHSLQSKYVRVERGEQALSLILIFADLYKRFVVFSINQKDYKLFYADLILKELNCFVFKENLRWKLVINFADLKKEHYKMLCGREKFCVKSLLFKEKSLENTQVSEVSLWPL